MPSTAGSTATTHSHSPVTTIETWGSGRCRVISDDRVAPGRFSAPTRSGTWDHLVCPRGSLQHRDSMGLGSVIRPGDVQRMSAGTGVLHSEFNASKTELVHFLQIWLLPAERGILPSYEQKAFTPADRRARLRVVASPDAREGSVTLHTDAVLYAGLFEKGEAGELALLRGRHAWVHVARGSARINGRDLETGDGAAISDEPAVRVEGVDDSEVLVFDLA